MNAVICLDEKNGMLFNKRRQSRDSILNQKLVALAGKNKIWMNSYSAKLFAEYDIQIDENFPEKAKKEDFCFFERPLTKEDIDNAQSFYVFLWNRHYPADVYFTFNLEQEGFTLSETEEFEGSSHEKITLNIYRR